MDFIWIAIIVFLGVMAATILCNVVRGGELLIDRKNPAKDIYRFSIKDSELEKIPKKRYILLKINPNANLTVDIKSK